MNAQVLAVLLLSWLLGATLAVILIWCKAKPRLVYCVYIGLGLLTGLAYDWAYGMSGSIPRLDHDWRLFAPLAAGRLAGGQRNTTLAGYHPNTAGCR